MSLIKPKILIGNFRDAQDLKFLQRNGVTHVLCSAVELYPVFPDRYRYLHVRANDIPSYNLAKHFHEGADFINDALQSGGTVFIHCAAGISRSVSLTLAYFLKHERMNLAAAHSLVKSKRYIANPNPGFMQQLRRFESMLAQEKSKPSIEAKLMPHRKVIFEDERLSIANKTMGYSPMTSSGFKGGASTYGKEPPRLPNVSRPAEDLARSQLQSRGPLQSILKAHVKPKQFQESIVMNPTSHQPEDKPNMERNMRLTGTSFGNPVSPYVAPLNKPPLLYNNSPEAAGIRKSPAGATRPKHQTVDNRNADLFNRYLKMTLPHGYQEPIIATYDKRTNSQAILGAYRTGAQFRPGQSSRPQHTSVHQDRNILRQGYAARSSAKPAFYY